VENAAHSGSIVKDGGRYPMSLDKDRLMKARGIVYIAAGALVAIAYLISRLRGA
jgi:hypothetical protein